MLKKNKKLIAALLALLVIAGSVAIAAEVARNVGPCGTWQYKLTVNIETPEGLKSGSAVREVEVCRAEHLVPEVADADVTVNGEAVAVDLGERGVMFALMDSNGSYQLVFEAFPFSGGGTTVEGIEHYSKLKNAKATLKPKQYPRIVRFRDLNDPKSVELVYKQKQINVQNQAHFDYEVTDNFEGLFGEGVRLKEITIEITDEPVTWGVQKWLPWLPEYYNKMLDGERNNYLGASNPVANSLSAGAFSTGRKE